MDIDSQTDGANAVMSGIDSESESDIADPDAEDEFPESQYTHSHEEEFGAVNYFSLNEKCYLMIIKNNILIIGWRTS